MGQKKNRGDDRFDFSTLRTIKRKQTAALKKAIRFAQGHSPFYRQLFKKRKLSHHAIRSLDDLQRFPVITKHHLREHNQRFYATGKDQWSEMFVTSGTTGDPIFLPHTPSDLIRLSYTSANCLRAAGVEKNDHIQLTLPVGMRMWAGGLCYWLGCQRIQCCSLRFGPGPLEYQIKYMRELRPSVLLGAPSFLIKLGLAICRENMPAKMNPRMILTIGENLLDQELKPNALGRQLQAAWPRSQVRTGYGITEGTFGAFECEARRGLHFSSQFVIAEIVDPRTHEVLPPGQMGMLVITGLDLRGMPLIRYATGDITCLLQEKCSCRRNSVKLGPVVGRIDQQMKIKGVKIYPSFIENILLDISEIDLYYIECYSDETSMMDQVRISLCVKEDTPDVRDFLNEKIRAQLGFSPQVEIKDRKVVLARITASGAKPKKFFDIRKKN